MITVDKEGKIGLVNQKTEKLFGYTREELIGQRIEKLVPERFRGKHPGHRDSFFHDPKARAMGAGRDLFGLKKDGTEIPIEIGLNPIETTEGKFVLASIIDITERKRMEKLQEEAEAQAYAESIVETVREPLLVLDKDLRVKSANHSFYQIFQVSKEETENQLIYDLGNKQWNIPKLRTLLEEILPRNIQFNDFEVEHTFPTIGRKVMLLNARRLYRETALPPFVIQSVSRISRGFGCCFYPAIA